MSERGSMTGYSATPPSMARSLEMLDVLSQNDETILSEALSAGLDDVNELAEALRKEQLPMSDDPSVLRDEIIACGTEVIARWEGVDTLEESRYEKIRTGLTVAVDRMTPQIFIRQDQLKEPHAVDVGVNGASHVVNFSPRIVYGISQSKEVGYATSQNDGVDNG